MTQTTFRPTADESANEYVQNNFFALLIGLVLDQQIPIERAFYAPFELKNRLGIEIEPESLLQIGESKIERAFSQKPALHRYPSAMARRVLELARIICESFGSKAENLYLQSKDAQDFISVMTKMPGFSDHKAKILTALMGKRLSIKLKGWEKASYPFSKKGVYWTVADLDGPKSLEKIRENKKLYKAGILKYE